MNIYYMTIKILGEPIDENAENDNATKVDITVTYLNYHSEGVLEFSIPVNMPAIISDYKKAFDVYVNNTLKEREEIREIVFTDIGSN